MRSELEHIERIEQYLLGILEGEVLLEFEKELNVSSQLREEVELQRILMKGLENAGLRKSLNHIHYSEYENAFAYWWRTWGKYVIGGIIVLTLVAGLTIFKKEQQVLPLGKEENQLLIGMDSLDLETGDSTNRIEEKISSLLDKDMPVFFEHYNPISKFFSQDKARRILFTIDPLRDTIVMGMNGTRINIPTGSFAYEDGQALSDKFTFVLKEMYRKSDIIMFDLVSKNSESIESSGGVFIDAIQNDKQLRLAKGRTLEITFKERIPHVDNPHSDTIVNERKPEFVYFKVFEEKPERRLILLPSIVLDYDIIYTRKSADPLMNERIESLLQPQYDQTFTSTTQFHYRIEGCQLFGKGTELLDIYLNNTHLKLWQADSLIINYLNEKAYQDCQNSRGYLKAAEYFRWLKSMKHGEVQRIKALDYRNYRKGQFYNKLPDKVLEKYFKDNGISQAESDELIGYFKKMFYFRKMFYKKTKYAQLSKESNLDYYYVNEGTHVAFEKNDCSEKRTGERKSHIYKTGDKLGTATELNYFMPVKRLGWINSERFINYKNIAPLKVTLTGLDTSCFSKVYVVFKDVNAVLGGKWNKDGVNYFDRIPKGSNVYLVALAYSNDSLYYGRKEFLIGNAQEGIIEMKIAEESYIKKDLSRLDP